MLPPHAFVRGMRCLFYLNFENISFEFLSRWLRNGLQHCETGKIACDTPFYQSISLSEISIKSYHFNANEHWS